MCHEFVGAKNHDRARPNTADEGDKSPARLLASAASGSTGGDPVLFNGYYFKVLTSGTRRGGLAVIAYPAEYRSSGVMTFIVTGNGAVYEKDLGANTSALASAMSSFHKDATWRAVSE
jgi:hypothetical protein